MDELDKILAVTQSIGKNDDARLAAALLLEAGQQALADPAAAVAAFEDIVDYVADPSTSSEMVALSVQSFEASLLQAGRARSEEIDKCTSILDNSAVEIRWLQRDLGEKSPPEGRVDPDRHTWDEDAGLSEDDRLGLCRRVLGAPPKARQHVLWLVYEHAKVRNSPRNIEFGPITFFDGPTLVDMLGEVAKGAEPADTGYMYVPDELVRLQREQPRGRTEVAWPTIDHWVATRVDLGAGMFPDPLTSARRQADSLVTLAAAAYNGRTSWRRLDTFLWFIDGRLASHTLDMGPRPDWDVLSDHTEHVLEALRPELAARFPVKDTTLAEILQAAEVLTSPTEQRAATAVVHDVRVMELIRIRSGSAGWAKHVESYFGLTWARLRALDAIAHAAEGIETLLRRLGESPRDNVRSFLPEDPQRYNIHYNVALEVVTELPGRLGAFEHTPAVRRLKTVASKVGDVQTFEGWIDELLDTYGRRLRRLKRCRDALVHGGPYSSEVTETVALFGNIQARSLLSAALWSNVRGDDLKRAYDEDSQAALQWKANISTATSVLDALQLKDNGTR